MQRSVATFRSRMCDVFTVNIAPAEVTEWREGVSSIYIYNIGTVYIIVV